MTEFAKNNSGKMVVFTAPSGAGKTTLVRHLLTKWNVFDFSVSATTRSKRVYETEGQDYYFITVDEFKNKIKNDEFIEWEEVYENQFYGTLHSEVDRIWNNGKAIIFDIDVVGAMNLKKLYGAACFTVFVKPPSIEILYERLKSRATETPEALAKRIEKVNRELKYENSFDAIIVNNELDIALKEAEILVGNFLKNYSASANK